MSRRELLAAGAVGAVAALTAGHGRAPAATRRETVDFPALGDGPGWPGFACVGAANLLRRDGEGLLEAGSDVFPNDPRPVAFAVDRRFADGAVSALITRTGAGAGVVARRVSPRDYYAAIVDTEQAALLLVRRSGFDVVELARAPLGVAPTPLRLTLEMGGRQPASLRATLSDAAGRTVTAAATDGHPALQSAGDPGVLATARTLFPSERVEAFPALGNVHLLPYGVQEGQAFIQSPAGEAVVGTIRERSTAGFREIVLEPGGPFGPTVASIVAATTVIEGGEVVARVATDVPARVSLDVAAAPDLRGARSVEAGRTGPFEALATPLGARADRVAWRARVRRGGGEAVGPVRRSRLPAANSPERVRVAVGACATQFGPIFDQLADRRPDVFVWQGDLNYPDTHGPLAQTMSGYAGIWRDFLANPRAAAILERTAFVPRRDDHDYGVQDANAANLPPFGLAPWDALMGDEHYTRFSAGLLDVWVLDQRRFKSPADAPDTAEKTLLGREQREWLLRTLAASRAPFKLVCSPCTLSPAAPQNARDGNWSAGYVAERDLLLRHVDASVTGTTLFLTGDTHFTMVYDRDGLFEARACPLDIPTPNDVTISEPLAAQRLRGRPGVVYADDEYGHVTIADARGVGERAVLELALLRPDGTTPYVKRFEETLPVARRRARGDEDGTRRSRRRRRSRRSVAPDLGSGASTSTPGVEASGSRLPFTGGQATLVALAGAAAAAAGAVARRIGNRRDE